MDVKRWATRSVINVETVPFFQTTSEWKKRCQRNIEGRGGGVGGVEGGYVLYERDVSYGYGLSEVFQQFMTAVGECQPR